MTILSDRDTRIVCMWLAGMKSEAIAAELGITRSPLVRRVKRLGLPPRGAAHGCSAPVNLWPCIVAWARQGRESLEIAKGIGCTKPDLIASIGASTCAVSRETKPRSPAEITARARASKRSWATRKRQAAARASEAGERAA